MNDSKTLPDSNQPTPAPLSFNSPQVRTAHEWAVTQRPYKLLTISERFALILADALTHEHEARVRAEKELAVAKKLADESEAHAQHESKLRDTMQTNCAGWAERIQQAEAERDSLLEFERYVQKFGDYRKSFNASKAAALSGLPAQAISKA